LYRLQLFSLGNCLDIIYEIHFFMSDFLVKAQIEAHLDHY
jgi:hypothetical protein